MSQVSILAIDLTQVADSNVNSSGGSLGSAEQASSAFSDVMAQHQQKEGGKNSRSGGKAVEKEAAGSLNDELKNDESLNRNVEQKGQESTKNAEVDAQAANETETKSGEQLLSSQEGEPGNDVTVSDEKLTGSVESAKVDKMAQQLLSLIAASDETSTEAATSDIGKASASKNVRTEAALETIRYASAKVLEKQVNKQDSSVLVTGESQQTGAATEEIKQLGKREITKDVVAETEVKTKIKAEVHLELDGKASASVVKRDIAPEQAIATKTEFVAESDVAADNTNKQVQKVTAEKVIDMANQPARALNSQQEVTLPENHPFENGEKAVAQARVVENNSVASEMDVVAKAVAQGLVEQSESTLKEKENNQPKVNNALVKESSELASGKLVSGKAEVVASNFSPERAVEPGVVASNVAVEAKMAEVKASERPQADRVINQATGVVLERSSSESSSQEQQTSSDKESAKQAVSNHLSSGNQVVEENSLDKAEQKVTREAFSVNANTNRAEESLARNLAHQSVSYAEEQAIQQVMAKANADSMSVQSAKSATSIQQETIAIYRKDFTNAVKEKVMVMINQKIKQLEIRLDPPELGSMNVRLNLQNEQAAVSFMVQNQQAKEALEQNMGKLKDMLAESGVDVGDTNIEQRDGQAGEQEEFAGQNSSEKTGLEEEQIENGIFQQGQNLYKASATGVDYYA